MAEPAALSLSRLIALADYISANPRCSVNETALHFGRSRKQIRKDIDLLVEAGFGDLLPGNTLELDYDAYETEGVLVLRTPLGLDKTPTITRQDLTLMVYGLHALSSTLSDEEATAIPSAVEKLLAFAGLPQVSAKGAIEAPIDVVEIVASAEKIRLIRDALDKSLALDLEYIRADGTRSSRKVYPLSLTFERNGWLLTAICDQSSERRSFRLDRMAKIELSEDGRTKLDLPHLDPASRGSATEPATCTVYLHPDAAWVALETAATKVRVTESAIEADFVVWDEKWIRTEVLLLAEYVTDSSPQDVMKDAGEFARQAISVWDAVLGETESRGDGK